MTELAGMKVLVTGGAGFVGSHLVDHLQAAGAEVTVFDNASTGQWRFLQGAAERGGPSFVQWQGNLRDDALLDEAVHGRDLIVHLAANADIRHGTEFPDRDFAQNVGGTQFVLRSMCRVGVKQIAFASTGAVYGNHEHSSVGIMEDSPFPIQDSFYGASKAAAEGLITAYCHAFNMQAWIFRFVPMLGERYSHGHVFDFVKKLQASPYSIEVFGTGEERKYCLYVGDAMEAVLKGIEHGDKRVNILNVGNNASYTIAEAVDWVASRMDKTPRITYTGTRWAGDNPNMFLDSKRIRATGWYPQVSLREAINRTVDYLLSNWWLLERES